MDFAKIVLFVIGIILILALALCIAVCRRFEKEAVVYRAIGKVESITRCRLPFTRRARISYTLHGKPHTAMTRPLFCWRHLKEKSMHQWLIKTYYTQGRGKLVLAKLKERRQ